MPPHCTIHLLGEMRVVMPERTLTRFGTRKAALLLAYLACYPQEPHPRETLMELLWPDSDPHAASTSLRVALASLRRQLEPPGVPTGAVLVATRAFLGLNAETVRTDVASFEAALRRAARTQASQERIAALEEAVSLYGGELLAGFYEDWVLVEQRRLAVLFQQAVHRLVADLEQAGEVARALGPAGQAVRFDPLSEAANRDIIRLYRAAGQPQAAVEQYHAFERLLERELGQAPPDDLRALVQSRLDTEHAPADHPRPQTRDQKPTEPSSTVASTRDTASPAPGPHHLPLRLTRFVGRELELTQLGEMLGNPHTDTRLRTLTGPAGSGKTRLAIETAERLAEAYAGAVWFVPLAGLADARLLMGVVAEAVGAPPAPGQDPLARLEAALAGRPALLVLDNFEHLVEDGTERVQALLARLPTLRLLVTSRRLLGLEGEREFPVPPLPTPSEEDAPESLLENESVRLFVDRAQAVRVDFQLTARNAGAVAELCRRLEGLPLAIELAAARVRVLTPAQMLAQLARRFEFLARRRGVTDDRHRSLEAALDGSYRLLAPGLQRFFARLSVFQGGWTVEAAEAVCDEPLALDALEHLREGSLVQAEERAEGMRFGMLETLREYAAGRLGPEETTALQQKHADYCLALARQAYPSWARPEEGIWLARQEPERANLRAAAGWYAQADTGAEPGLELAEALWRFWHVRGHWAEGRAILATALARAPEKTPLRGRALKACGVFAFQQNDNAAAGALFEEGLELFRELSHPVGQMDLLNALGNVINIQGDRATARGHFEEALALAREHGNAYWTGTLLGSLGGLCMQLGAYADAERYCSESLPLLRERGDKRAIGMALNTLAGVKYYQGDYDATRELMEERLTLVREMRDLEQTAQTLNNLGQLALSQGDYPRARDLCREALEIRRAQGERRAIALALRKLSVVTWKQKDMPGARAMLVEALALIREVDDREGMAASLYHLARIAAESGARNVARTHFRESLDLAQALGARAMILENLEGLAVLLRAEGEPERAARLSGAAAALRKALGQVRPPYEVAEYEAHLAALTQSLGAAVFQAAFEDGQRWTEERAITEARAILQT